ncbi:hypothetical protein Taro_049125 [Colocasia esculenta]|uniref:Uncharacterized protein n=1 Tax=Colocasia esculenta TaxID=4460 RepID=A0A843XA23_COLES|nr:hypothetical protein [Colocasia esculenta]
MGKCKPPMPLLAHWPVSIISVPGPPYSLWEEGVQRAIRLPIQRILKMAERYRLTRRRVRQIFEQEEHMHSHGVNDPNPPIQVSEPHKLSEVNKKNRAKQQLISNTGPKSIAKRQQDYEEKMGQQMSLIQTFKMMYTKKNGEPSTSVAAEKFVEIDNILSSQTNDGSDNNANAKESEILSEVLGKEHPGKPRCYGSFVSSTDVYGPKNKHGRFQHNCPRVQQMEEEFVFMKNKMVEMETHYKSLEEKLCNVMNTRNQQVNHECNNVPSERSNEENDVVHSLNGRSSAGSCVFPSLELMRRDHSYATVYDLVNAEKVVEEWR